MGMHTRSGRRLSSAMNQQKRPALVEPTFPRPCMLNWHQQYPAGTPRMDGCKERHMRMGRRDGGAVSGRLLLHVSR